MAVLRQTEGIEAERRESGEAAAHPHHDELALARARKYAAIRAGQSGVEADQERTHDVHEKRAYGKAGPEQGDARQGHESAQHAADHTSESDCSISPKD